MNRTAISFALVGLLLAAALAASSPIVGTWDCVSPGPNGESEMQWTLTMKEVDGRLVGTAAGQEGETEIVEPKFESGTLSFKVIHDSGAINVELKLKDDKLEGAWKNESGQTGAIRGARRA
jgi:hypothetical protein